MRETSWRRANNLLLVAIVLINGYIIAAPFLPALHYWQATKNGANINALAARLAPTPAGSTPTDSPPPNTGFRADASHDGLIIPTMLLDTPVVEGPESKSKELLVQAWRLPFSATPDKGGNTVIAGHRFSYTGPRGVFYYLNKLSPGDDIGYWYRGTLYRYRVVSSRIVPPTEVSVQEPTPDTRLTLYTCTPLWNPTHRLVVVATPKEAI